MPKRVVISAVNLIEGGPLTVLREALASAERTLPPEWEIIALVHRADLIVADRARAISVPKAKRSWLHRLYYEWIAFQDLSRRLEPDLWVALHDITPRVTARRQVVYCHNPSPFYDPSLRESLLAPRFYLFTQLYQHLYRAFIR